MINSAELIPVLQYLFPMTQLEFAITATRTRLIASSFGEYLYARVPMHCHMSPQRCTARVERHTRRLALHRTSAQDRAHIMTYPFVENGDQKRAPLFWLH